MDAGFRKAHGRLAIALVSVAIGTVNAQSPLFRTAIEYVSVDVVVTDKNDKPVTDLRKDEFVITENKRQQTIKDFQFVSIPVEHRTIDVTAPQPPEPDVATNVPPSRKSRLFAMVVDDLHILESEIVPIKGLMTEFVKALSPNDEVAIVFVGRSDLSQNFTTNTGRLLRTIDRAKEAIGFGMDSMGHTTSVQLKNGVAGYNTEVLNYTRSMLSVLRNVSASLAGSGHPRRAIVYVGHGTNMDFTPDMRGAKDGKYYTPDMERPDPIADEYLDAPTMRAEMNDVFDSAHRANVPIYTLDPRGLLDSNLAVRGGIGVIKDPPAPGLASVQQEIEHRFRNEVDSLATMAINTGGRAFTNQSNLIKAIDEIVGENGSYYVLGYSPDPVARDGKYHPFDVKVTRPGLIVRSRKGYVASAPVSTSTTTDLKPVLDKAISAGVNVSGLSLRASAAPVASTTAGMTTVVTVELTCPAPIDGAKNITDNLQLSVVALDPDAKIKASFTRPLHFSTPVPDGAATVSFLINDTITLPSQPLTLRIGVASQGLDRAGTTQLSIDVPKPSDSRLQLGGVVLGFADFGRQATLQRELISGLVPFQPTTTRTFRATDTLRVFDRLFWGSKDAAADVTLTITGETAPPGIVPQVVHITGAPAEGNPSRHEGALATLVPLKGLGAGAYVLRIEAKLAGGQVAHRDVPFEVK